MEPLEKYDNVQRISHSARSISLAGDPIAKLSTPCPYSNLLELNNVRIASVSCHDKAQRIHKLKISSIGDPFKYMGYTSLAQIGQYFAVTAVNNTRLYTMVNFLQDVNVKMMYEISPSIIAESIV